MARLNDNYSFPFLFCFGLQVATVSFALQLLGMGSQVWMADRSGDVWRSLGMSGGREVKEIFATMQAWDPSIARLSKRQDLSDVRSGLSHGTIALW